MYNLLIILFILGLPSWLFGYLDPGTGTALVSLIIAGISSLIFFMRGIVIRLLKKDTVVNKDRYIQPEIAILSEGKQYYGTFAPIIRSLIEKEKHFSYYSLDVEDPALEIDNEYMHSKFLGYGNIAYYRASNIKSKLLLSTTPNLGNKEYPIGKPKEVRKLVHVFHSVDDISMYKTGSLDYYDAVILSGDFQKPSIKEIEKVRNLPAKELISLGLPYLDELLKEKKETDSDTNKTTVLIGSSWGDKGCLKTYGTDFIKRLADEGFNIIIRPHPQSFISELELIQKSKQDLKLYQNVSWDKHLSPAVAMNQADVLISDTSSIRFDFAFIYEKPVITLSINQDDMPGYERDVLTIDWRGHAEKEIGYVLDKTTILELPKIIKDVLNSDMSQRIINFRKQTLTNIGHSGSDIADYLIEQSGKGIK